MWKVVLCLVVTLMAACGPSSQQIAEAKAARYHGSRVELFSIAKQVAAKDYRIGPEDLASFTFATNPQWYAAEGGRQSVGAGDRALVSENSIALSLIVEVVDLGGQSEWAVVITPRTLQYVTGSPKPRELTPDDPNLPPWVHGRVDALALAIHQRAHRMQTK